MSYKADVTYCLWLFSSSSGAYHLGSDRRRLGGHGARPAAGWTRSRMTPTATLAERLTRPHARSGVLVPRRAATAGAKINRRALFRRCYSAKMLAGNGARWVVREI